MVFLEVKNYSSSQYVSSPLSHSPLKSGAASHTVAGPLPEYWPTDSSIRNTGMPTNVNIMKYGIKKAPGESCFYIKGMVFV